MRIIPISLGGLIIALAASASIRAEPTFSGGRSAPSFLHQGSGHGADNGKQCVSARSVRAESAQGSERLILHIDSRAFVSHLPAPCDGLASINNLGKLHLQAKDGKYCAGDSFTVGGDRLLSVIGLESDDGQTRCTLGPFEPMSETTLSEEFRR